MPTAPAISPIFGTIAEATTAVITSTFATPLPASKAEFGPNRRLMPAAGLSRFGSGFSACMFRRGRTWATFTSTPAARQTNRIGATAAAAAPKALDSSEPMPSRLTTSGVEISVRPWYIEFSSCPVSFGPKEPSATSAASITIAPFMSFERATCPFLRASLRRLGVGFSVRSPDIAQATWRL